MASAIIGAFAGYYLTLTNVVFEWQDMFITSKNHLKFNFN